MFVCECVYVFFREYVHVCASFLVSLCMCVSVCLPRLFPTPLFWDRIFLWAWIFRIVEPGWPCSISTVLGLNPVGSCLPLHMCSGNGTEFLTLSQQAFCWLSHFLSPPLHFFARKAFAFQHWLAWWNADYIQVFTDTLWEFRALSSLNFIEYDPD